jgi:hypothetical protein
MRSDKSLAIKLRKGGKTYSQISKILTVPKSTLSSWLKDISLSDEAKRIIEERVSATAIAKLISRNKQRTIVAQQKNDQTRQLAKKEFVKLSNNPLFIAGISLYWAEGYKQGALGGKQKNIDFTNADPEMIKLMVNFFTEFLPIDRKLIRAQIMIHNIKNSEKAINFWHSLTQIPKQNFIKTCCLISRASSRKRKRTLEHGTIHLRIYDVNKFFRLIGWIDGLKNKFNL